MLLAYFLTLVVVLFTWYQKKYARRNSLLSKIPGLPSYPLIGSSFFFVGKSAPQIFNTLVKASQELGNCWRFDLTSFQSNIVISEPKLAEAILSSQKLLEKSSEYDLIKDWLGQGWKTLDNFELSTEAYNISGLLLSTGSKWHQRRKVITPAFHFKILEEFTEAMDKQGHIFVSNLKKFEGENVDFFNLISLYALDVICESAMGCKINAQIDSSSEYVKAVKQITNIAFVRMLDIKKRFMLFYQFSDMYKVEKETLQILHGFSDSVIVSRRNELENSAKTTNKSPETLVNDVGLKKKTALLDLLLQSTIDGKPLTNEDIREEVDTFMFEGHDTTTSGISFILYNLAKYPNFQQKVFEEARTVLGDDPTEAVTMHKLNDLHYLDLVIKETLRLYPSVPFYGRKIREEITIGDFTFPEATSVLVAPYFMGRDPEIFPDPLTFDPNRFNVETTNVKNNPFSYVPFSAGPRNCIGQKFAVLEMKSIVSKIIRSFELSITAENEKLELVSELILRPINGIVLCAKERVYQ